MFKVIACECLAQRPRGDAHDANLLERLGQDIETAWIDNEHPGKCAGPPCLQYCIVDMLIGKAVADDHEMRVRPTQVVLELLKVPLQYFVLADQCGLVAAHDEQAATVVGMPVA